jgi:competence protein ComEC
MTFYDRPFVFITLSFLVGLVLAFACRTHVDLLAYGSFLPLFLVFFLVVFRARGIIFLGLSCLSFCGIGSLLMLERLHVVEGNELEEMYRPGDICVFRICESKQGKGDWNKAIGEVKQHIGTKVKAVRSENVLFLIHKNESIPEVGDQVAISSALMAIRNEGNPGEFDAEMFWGRQGINKMAFVSRGELLLLNQAKQSLITKWINASRNYLRSALTAHLSGAELAISLALILGDNSMLDKEIRDSFTNTGALHVLAVSGLHISIIMQILMAVLAVFSGVLSRRIAVILLIGIMWWYAAITGLSPSVLRAVIMFTVLSIAQLSGRNYDSLNTLLFTAFLLVLWNPLTVFDIGFQLSFLAMLGIFLFYEKIASFWVIQQAILQKVWQGTAIGLAAQVMTTPLSLHYFNQFPNYFILTNIGLMASSGLILGGGLLIFSVSWWGFVAKWIGFVLMLVVGLSLWFIQWVESLPGAVAFGFTVNFWTVLALGVLFPLLFYFKVGTRGFWISLVVVFGILVGIVFQRFQNIHRNEIIVFNARMVVMAVRVNGHVFCFYRSKKADFFKVERLIGNYLKVHSGKVHYCNLDRQNWNINVDGFKIVVEPEKGWVNLACDRQKVRILMDDAPIKRLQDVHLIAMPWIKATPQSPIEHYLYKRSWRLAI